MADENPNLDIRATLDSSGVSSGASSAVAQIGAVTAATEDAQAVAATYSVSLATAERALAILAATAGTASSGLGDLDAAMDLAQAEAVKAAQANAAYAESLAASAAETIAAGEAQEALGTVTAATAKKLAALSIEQSAVAATAAEMSISMEVAAAAMIQIERARLAETITEARLAMEGLTVATEEEAVAADVSAGANALDAEALAKRALMMRRTSDGLVDIALGGRRAIQGVADLQYVLTGLFPEGAATIGIIAGIALIGELWERISQKIEKEQRETMEKVKKSTDDAAENYKEKWKEASDDAVKSLNAVFEAQEAIRKSEEASLQLLRDRADLTKRQEELDKTAALQKLQQGYIDSESNPNLTDEGRKTLKRNYDAGRKDIEEQSTVNTSSNEFSTAKAEADNLKQQQVTQNAAVRDNQNTVDDMAKKQADALAFIAENYLVLNKQTHEITDAAGKNAVTVAEGKRDEAAAAYGKAQQNGASTSDIDAALAARDAAQQQVDLTNYAQQILAQSKALEDAQKDLKKSQDESAATALKLADALTKVDQSSEALTEAQKQAALDSRQRAIDANNDFQKENARGVRENTDELVKRFRSGQKSSEASGEKPLQEHLQKDRDAVTQQQNAIRELADHAKAMGEQGKQHAQQTAQLAASMKVQLDQLREAVQRDEEALRQFKQSNKTNALQ